MNFADNQEKPQEKSTISKPSTNIAIALLLISALLVSPLIAIGQTPTVETVCDDGIDDDNDGLVDSDDPHCQGQVVTVETVCDDGIDDDNDGLVDSDDPDCQGQVVTVETVCDDGIDDDNDGLVDSDDPDCQGQVVTVETVCDDGIDDDNDGLVDSDDPDCQVPRGNNITISTPRYQIVLNYSSGVLDVATNVIYRVHFDFGDIDASFNATD